MFRKLSLITAVAGLALLSAVPAFGKSTSLMSEQWQKALVVRGEAMNDRYGLGDSTQIVTTRASHERALTLRGQALNHRYGLGDSAQIVATKASFERALTLRGQELNRQHELGTFRPTSTYIDANERAARVNGIQPTTTPDVFERAVAARVSTPEPTFLSGDDHVRIDPSDLPTVVATSSSSGSELEWPQVGIGFGIGIALMLGIALTLRYSGTRPLAH